MTNNLSDKKKPWLFNYGQGTPEKILYEKVCLPEFLEISAKRFPNRAALIFQGYRVTFNELNKMVDIFAASIAEFGIKKGDKVALLLPNIIPCVVAYYATLKLGAIVVMNNPLYSDREILHQLNNSGSKLLITLDLLTNRVIDLRPKTNIENIIYTSLGDYLPFPKSILFPFIAKKKGLALKVKPAEKIYLWKKMLLQTQKICPQVKISFDDVAMYQYTGGTTGVSKGAILTHGNLSVQIQQLKSWFYEFKRGKEIILGALPFFHAFGLMASMNLAIYRGWTNILVPKPIPNNILEAISKFRPTLAPLVPTMYIGMLNNSKMNKTDMTSLKGFFSGSASLPLEVIKSFEKNTGAVIGEGFGITEASPITHINPLVEDKRKLGSIGLPISDTDARVVDMKDGKTDVPIGEAGELIVKGPQVMKGYLNKPDDKDTLKDGWLYTGDIAKMDEDGYFYIIDRKKDMIISGGFNVYPRDIEDLLYKNPKVREVAAIGIPHPRRGESIKVFIVLKEGKTGTSEEFIKYCQGKLAKYKWPTKIEFRKELPKSNVGKILKKELRS